MPTIETSAGNIAYRESSGTDNPAFLLIHGNSSSSSSFQRILDSELGKKHRMVAMDLPGHGESDKANEPESTYHMPGYAKIVVEVATALDLMDAVVVGWSLGGHITLEAVPHLPSAKGFVIFGTPPLAFPPAMELAFMPNPNVNFGFAPELTEEQMRAYVTDFFKPDTADIPENFMEDIRKTDGQARETMGASIQPDGYADEVKIVKTMSQPLMIIHGEQEKLINGDYFGSIETPTLWGGQVQIVADTGHAPHWEAPDQFTKLLESFVSDI